MKDIYINVYHTPKGRWNTRVLVSEDLRSPDAHVYEDDEGWQDMVFDSPELKEALHEVFMLAVQGKLGGEK